MARASTISAVLERGYTMEQLRGMDWDEFVEVTGLEPREIDVTLRGTRYRCLDIPFWDPERKSGTHRRKTIGYYEGDRLIMSGSDEDTRPRTRPKAERYAVDSEIGRTLLLESIAERIGLGGAVRDAFGKDAPAILTCAYFMASCREPLTACEQWSAQADTPYGGRLADQRISELLQRIDADGRARFFRTWMERVGEDDSYALDITSISSYSESMAIVRAGYNRDRESLEQINLALLIGSRSRLPVCYSVIPGNVNDKTSLERFLHTVRAMGLERFSLVMDKGFCTAANMDEMQRMGLRFVQSMENRVDTAKSAIDSVRDGMARFDNYIRVYGSDVYAVTKHISRTVDGVTRGISVHVFYDPQKKLDEEAHLAERLDEARAAIMAGKGDASQKALARKYLKVTRRGGAVQVTARQDAIEEANRYSGFLVLLSNHVDDRAEALRIYRDKETAESAFDDLKNGMDMKRLRVRSETALNGKMFIAFLGLALKLEMSNVMDRSPELAGRTREEVLREMSILRSVRIGEGNEVFTERTKLQKRVVKDFGIKTSFKDRLDSDRGQTEHS
ncbi:MAG: IS1634 family transposase [Thermoplasmata archaeon]|nr:IS1634 family transposase [Thermoplasmata archaeon]